MDSVTYSLALFFHIFGAVMFFAGIVLAGVAFEIARRQRQPGEIVLLLGLTRVGVVLVAIGGLLLPAFGLWMVHLGHWGYGSGWVTWALILYVLALALGAAGGQRPKQARKLARDLSARDAPIDDELRKLLDDPLSRVANYASLAVVVAILALMVFK